MASAQNGNEVYQDNLRGTKALIIGGTSGIGEGVASAALAVGVKVFVSSSKQSSISNTVSAFRKLYPQTWVSGAAADLSSVDTIEANLETLLKTAVKELDGPLDHIVYTAGDTVDLQSLSEVTAKNAYAAWTVRYLGPLLLGKLITTNPETYLPPTTRSSICLTSGMLGTRPLPGLSKSIGWVGAVETLNKALAVDLAPIRVNVISPGAIRTPMLEKLGEEAIDKFAQRVLVKKVGSTHEIAEAYLYCMRCSFVTGEKLVVDGGYI